MLRALVVLLVLANLGFWAWSTGTLAIIGLAPAQERDPSRLEQQVRADAVRVLAPAEAAAALGAASAAAAPRSAASAASGASSVAPSTNAASAALAASNAAAALLCLEAGPFAPAAVEAAERALAAVLPAGSWLRVRKEVAAQYAVVLGPFVGREGLQKKADELGRLRVTFEEINLPADGAAPAGVPRGFALGRYDNRAAAEAALAAFSARGVRTARVAMLRATGSEAWLRVDNASATLAERARAISAAALGAGFAPCAPAAVPR
jgi:hypothetical protein